MMVAVQLSRELGLGVIKERYATKMAPIKRLILLRKSLHLDFQSLSL